MLGWQQKSPVALLIFNRPDKTEAVFEVVREAKPPKLLVVADGPRADRLGEAEKCAAARAITAPVDWDCEVLRNYSDVNLGVKRRVVSGLDWVFSEVEEAIILEDDCVPHPTFFRYCDELLARYPDTWGWATWRRAWKLNDIEMKLWPMVREGGWLEDILQDPAAVRYWASVFQSTYEGHQQAWDYQWVFSCWLQSGLSVLPNVNLVTNIGLGPDATHPVDESPSANLPAEEITLPLRHPPFVIRDTIADDFEQRFIYGKLKLG